MTIKRTLKYIYISLLFIAGCEPELTPKEASKLSFEWANNLGIEEPHVVCFKRPGDSDRIAWCNVYGKNLNQPQKLLCNYKQCRLEN